jgi:hypothetical protein
VDPVPEPLLLRKSGSAGTRTRTSGSVASNSNYWTTEAVHFDIRPCKNCCASYRLLIQMDIEVHKIIKAQDLLRCADPVPGSSQSARHVQCTASQHAVSTSSETDGNVCSRSHMVAQSVQSKDVVMRAF